MNESVVRFDASWRARCRVVVADRATVAPMIRAHYIGKWPGVTVLILALTCDGRPVGACVFALPPRETAKRYGGITWELARLWVADEMPTNVETYFMARAVRHIQRARPEVVALVSYADPSAGHSGVIYRAAGWEPDGRTDQERKTPRFDYYDTRTGRRYSRRAHVPTDATLGRIPRVSKHRFVKRLRRSSKREEEA